MTVQLDIYIYITSKGPRLIWFLCNNRTLQLGMSKRGLVRAIQNKQQKGMKISSTVYSYINITG